MTQSAKKQSGSSSNQLGVTASKSSIIADSSARLSDRKQGSIDGKSDIGIKIKVNKQMIDLKDLVKLCN